MVKQPFFYLIHLYNFHIVTSCLAFVLSICKSGPKDPANFSISTLRFVNQKREEKM